jgi:hypothetical protein
MATLHRIAKAVIVTCVWVVGCGQGGDAISNSATSGTTKQAICIGCSSGSINPGLGGTGTGDIGGGGTSGLGNGGVAGTGTGGGAGNTGPVNCSSAKDCAANEYCNSEGSCGGGVCAARPQECAFYCPVGGVCGCDGHTYCNPCLAHAAGVDSTNAACSEHSFKCGNLLCHEGQYCYEISGGAVPINGGPTVHYSCEGLPTSCTNSPTCDTCFPWDRPGICTCSSDANGNLTQSCFAP